MYTNFLDLRLEILPFSEAQVISNWLDAVFLRIPPFAVCQHQLSLFSRLKFLVARIFLGGCHRKWLEAIATSNKKLL